MKQPKKKKKKKKKHATKTTRPKSFLNYWIIQLTCSFLLCMDIGTKVLTGKYLPHREIIKEQDYFLLCLDKKWCLVEELIHSSSSCSSCNMWSEGAAQCSHGFLQQKNWGLYQGIFSHTRAFWTTMNLGLWITSPALSQVLYSGSAHTKSTITFHTGFIRGFLMVFLSRWNTQLVCYLPALERQPAPSCAYLHGPLSLEEIPVLWDSVPLK